MVRPGNRAGWAFRMEAPKFRQTPFASGRTIAGQDGFFIAIRTDSPSVQPS